MVRTCANPACNEPFVYFRSGKIYLVDRRTSPVPPQAREQLSANEYFWLCGRCAATMKVVLCANGAVTVAEIAAAKRDGAQEQPSPLPQRRVVPFSIGQRLHKDTLMDHHSRTKVLETRILVLDAESETLAFLDQMLQDAALDVMTTASVGEAILLLPTGFFNTFIAIEHPLHSHADGTAKALAAARAHCKECFCWSARNFRQRCREFLEKIQQKPFSESAPASSPPDTAFRQRPAVGGTTA